MTVSRVLVTGAAGFTGRYVVSALQEIGLEAVALQSNICDLDSLKKEVKNLKPEAAIHLAGIAYVGHGNPADFYQVNVIGTLNLLRALDSVKTISGPVVIASSANIYGNIYQDQAIEETFRPHPENDYAVSKLAMEQMARLWLDKLPLTIVRPFNYTGRGQSSDFVVPKIVSAFQEKRDELFLGNIDVWRDFSDVRDVARWYSEIITKSVSGEILNLCSGKMVSIREIITLCETITNHHIIVRTEKKLCRDSEIVRLCGSRKKLENVLNNNSIARYSLEQTLEWMV